MSARWTSRFALFLAPFAVLACGDDTTTGTGGGGGSGGGSTTATTTGPVTSSSSVTTSATTTASSSSSSSSSSSDGGGGSGDGGFNQGGGGGGDGGSGGSGGGEGGAGGAMVVDGGEDACPGDDPALALAVDGGAIAFLGTTEGATDDEDTCFLGEANGADLVYAFTIDQTVTLHVELTDGEDFDGNLAVRSVCESDVVTDGYCYLHSANGDVKAHSLEVAAGTYYVVVDSAGTAEGEFRLEVEAASPACGDGVLNAGEDCDVGAGMPDDGCGDPGAEGECEFEEAVEALDICPGQAIAVGEGMTRLLSTSGFTTLGYTDDYDGSCLGGFDAPDRVIAITPAVSGLLTVEIGYEEDGSEICVADIDDPRCWDYGLYLRTTCLDAESEVAVTGCSDGGEVPESVSAVVVAGTPIFLFVDGYDLEFDSQGPFDLDITLEGMEI
jgi:hypothetical protein